MMELKLDVLSSLNNCKVLVRESRSACPAPMALTLICMQSALRRFKHVEGTPAVSFRRNDAAGVFAR